MPRLEELIDPIRLQRAAEGSAPFEPNAFMERLIEMRATRPQSFASMSPASKLALGHYEAAKRPSGTHASLSMPCPVAVRTMVAKPAQPSKLHTPAGRVSFFLYADSNPAP